MARRAASPAARCCITSRNWEREQPGGREEVERGGRRRPRSPASGRRAARRALELTVDTVTEVLTVWPFTADELLDDLRDAGLEPQDSTYTPEAERYLVASSRR